MAATKGLHYIERFRERVKVSLLQDALTEHALGMREMTNSQVAAAKILLDKVVPTVASVEHSGEIIQTHYVAELPAITNQSEQWQKQHNQTVQ